MRAPLRSWKLLPALLALSSCGSAPPSAKPLTQEDYARAERFLGWNVRPLVFNLDPTPVWIGDEERFWYVRESRAGKEFILVDALRKQQQQQAAFDHPRLAASLSQATGSTHAAGALPFDTFEYVSDGTSIRFHLGEEAWTCTLDAYRCTSTADAIASGQGRAVSPDKQWAAFIRDDDLWVRSLAGRRDVRLTADGGPHDAYAVQPDANTTAITSRLRFPGRPDVNVLWSPDSSRLVTYKLDETRMRDSYLVQSVPPGPIGAVRPVLHAFRFPYPGDKEVATARYSIFDPRGGKAIPVDLPVEDVTYETALVEGKMWWSADSRTVYVVLTDRWALTLKLFAVDAATGKSRLLIEEHGDTELETVPGRDGVPAVQVIRNGRSAIWFSERDGWGHLYLYDLDSRGAARQITRGEWTVRSIERVDETGGFVYFTASGREPGEDAYLRHLYRIRLDGTGLELLTPENADHTIVFSRSGRFFVDVYSRVDAATQTVLRDEDGNVVQNVSAADLTGLIASGWKFPEPFVAKAADGTTDIYGVIYRPSNFDPRARYPVIDSIYPGPQHIRSAKTLTEALDETTQALAELGFVVITVEGRGTPLRSRAFHDYSYRRLGVAGGLEDHVAAIRQLSQRYPYMDAGRVGIYGHSAGGFATVRAMLAYPDFYKVGVSSAGNHDQRGNIAAWGERYQGRLEDGDYEEASNPVLAVRSPLKGKLLLAWGDMDDNVSPFLSVQLIDSLIRTNSDFDALVLPNCNHRLVSLSPYFIRRRWDYFVRHLAGREPPPYEIKTASPDYRPLQPASADVTGAR